MKKYELTTDTKIVFGKTLFRIKALMSFGDIKKGDVGGYVEKEENLARVSGNAWVYGNARVFGNARVMWFSKVGSENGTLTAFQDKDKNIMVTRGCFLGTIDEFEKAVKEKHRNSTTEQEYKLLIEYIKLRFSNLGSQS